MGPISAGSATLPPSSNASVAAGARCPTSDARLAAASPSPALGAVGLAGAVAGLAGAVAGWTGADAAGFSACFVARDWHASNSTPKRTSGFGLPLAPRDASTRAYQWMYAGLRGAILRGQLRPGARLPSTRELATQHGVARGTVVAAFAQLESEGYVNSTTGSGTYVNAVLPDDLLQVAPRTGARAARPPRRTLSDYAARVTTFPALQNRPTRAFRSNLPALDPFPIAVWAQLASRRLRGASTRLLLSSELLGHRPLREAIADYLGASRGVTCHADLIDRFSAVRSVTSRHLPMLEQAIVCDFITAGHFGRHLRRMRELYAERLSVLMDGARRELAGGLELSPIEAGLQTIGWLAPGLPAMAVAEAAAVRNVEVLPLRRVRRGAMPRDGLQLGFAAVNPREIRRGVSELAHVLAHQPR